MREFVDDVSELKVFAERVALEAPGGGLVWKPALMGIRAGAFTSVAPVERSEAMRLPEWTGTVDLGGRLVTPCFVNSHTHLAMSALRGLMGAQERAGNLVEDGFFARERRMGPEAIRAFARVGAYESLLCGVGRVWEHYYGGIELARGIADAGLGAVVAPTLQDLGGPGAPSLEAALEATSAIASDAALRASGVHAALGPHASDTVSESLWRRVFELAGTLGLPVHAHLAQSREEWQRCQQSRGCSPVRWLSDMGLLTEPAELRMAHLIFASSADLALLNPARHLPVFCPWSQLQFAFAADPLRWQAAGLDWLVATDCGASSDSMSVVGDLRLTGAMHGLACTFSDAYGQFAEGAVDRLEELEKLRARGLEAASGALSPDALLGRVWSLAGRGGPHLPTAGSIRVGAEASLISFDPDHPALWPCRDPSRALVMGDATGAIDGMLLRGQWVGERGRYRESLLQDGAYKEALAEAEHWLTLL